MDQKEFLKSLNRYFREEGYREEEATSVERRDRNSALRRNEKDRRARRRKFLASITRVQRAELRFKLRLENKSQMAKEKA